LLRTWQWVGPKGERPFLPKRDVAGVVVSAFLHTDLRFGSKISQQQLEEIHFSRRGKCYKDEGVAMEVFGTLEKQGLKESPFRKYFEFGMNNEGYWRYSHMVTQLEDCVDCLKVMYPQFKFIFLFDHSSGHSKKRIGRLDDSSMNKELGGAQPSMRISKMEAEDGFLGPFDRILSVREVQSMHFLPTDSDLFWMTETEQEDCQQNRTRPDRTPAARQEKIKKELAEKLSLPGATINPQKQKL
jgi:hypothetical protein